MFDFLSLIINSPHFLPTIAISVLSFLSCLSIGVLCFGDAIFFFLLVDIGKAFFPSIVDFSKIIIPENVTSSSNNNNLAGINTHPLADPAKTNDIHLMKSASGHIVADNDGVAVAEFKFLVLLIAVRGLMINGTLARLAWSEARWDLVKYCAPVIAVGCVIGCFILDTFGEADFLHPVLGVVLGAAGVICLISKVLKQRERDELERQKSAIQQQQQQHTKEVSSSSSSEDDHHQPKDIISGSASSVEKIEYYERPQKKEEQVLLEKREPTPTRTLVEDNEQDQEEMKSVNLTSNSIRPQSRNGTNNNNDFIFPSSPKTPLTKNIFLDSKNSVVKTRNNNNDFFLNKTPTSLSMNSSSYLPQQKSRTGSTRGSPQFPFMGGQHSSSSRFFSPSAAATANTQNYNSINDIINNNDQESRHHTPITPFSLLPPQLDLDTILAIKQQNLQVLDDATNSENDNKSNRRHNTSHIIDFGDASTVITLPDNITSERDFAEDYIEKQSSTVTTGFVAEEEAESLSPKHKPDNDFSSLQSLIAKHDDMTDTPKQFYVGGHTPNINNNSKEGGFSSSVKIRIDKEEHRRGEASSSTYVDNTEDTEQQQQREEAINNNNNNNNDNNFPSLRPSLPSATSQQCLLSHHEDEQEKQQQQSVQQEEDDAKDSNQPEEEEPEPKQNEQSADDIETQRKINDPVYMRKVKILLTIGAFISGVGGGVCSVGAIGLVTVVCWMELPKTIVRGTLPLCWVSLLLARMIYTFIAGDLVLMSSVPETIAMIIFGMLGTAMGNMIGKLVNNEQFLMLVCVLMVVGGLTLGSVPLFVTLGVMILGSIWIGRTFF